MARGWARQTVKIWRAWGADCKKQVKLKNQWCALPASCRRPALGRPVACTRTGHSDIVGTAALQPSQRAEKSRRNPSVPVAVLAWWPHCCLAWLVESCSTAGPFPGIRTVCIRAAATHLLARLGTLRTDLRQSAAAVAFGTLSAAPCKCHACCRVPPLTHLLQLQLLLLLLPLLLLLLAD